MPWNSPESIAAAIGLTDEVVDARLQMLELTKHQRHRLALVWPVLDPHAPEFIESLYQRIRSVPELSQILQSESRVAALMQVQQKNLKQLYCDEIDANYVRNRVVIGLTHHRIRVTPQWYLASYSHFLCDHIDRLLSSAQTSNDGLEQLAILLKSIFLDASLVLDAYGRSQDASILEHNRSMAHAAQHDGPSVDMATPETAVETEPVHREFKRIRLTSEETDMRRSYLELTDDDVRQLSDAQPVFLGATSAVLDEFYRFVRSSPVLSRLVSDEVMERLVPQVRAYWAEFVSEDFDRARAASRMRIGVIHEQIGLDLQWYLIGLARQAVGFLRSIPLDTPDLSSLLKAIVRGLFFDMTFVVDAYMEARRASLLRVDSYASQVMSGLTSAVVIVDSLQRVLFANDTFLSLVGIEPALLYMMNLRHAFPSETAVDAIERIRQRHANRVTRLIHWGTAVYRTMFIELADHGDRPSHSIAILLDDVTHLVQMNGERHQESIHYQRLANEIAAVIWELDCKTGILATISRPVLTLTGYRDVHFLGRANAWLDVVEPDDRQRFVSACERLIVDQHCHCEYRIVGADGMTRWVRSFLACTLDTAQEKIVAAVTLDVTQSRLADQLRLASITQIGGGVAHVVNNALTVIMGNIELHAAEHGGLIRDSSLEHALEASKRASSVVTQLQVFSRSHFVHLEDLNLNSLVEQSVREQGRLLRETIQLDIELASDLWPCRLDRKMLMSAVGHLLSNASDAIEADGRVLISTHNVVEADPSRSEGPVVRDWVELRVDDNGKGMSAETVRRAQEPFFSSKSLAESNGLGLSFIYGFVTQCGGHLVIESQVGEGTSVRLRFPRKVSTPVVE